MPAALIALATPAGCSPRQPADRGGQQAVSVERTFRLGPAAPTFELSPADCGSGRLIVSVRSRGPDDSGRPAFVIKVESLAAEGARRVAAHTPYPVGQPTSFSLAASDCGERGLRFSLHPVETGARVPDVEIAIASSEG